MNILQTIQEWDINTLVGIQSTLNADWLTPIMKAITMLGEKGLFWIILVLVLIACKRTRKLGILCGCSLLLCFLLCNGIIKPLVGRVRPWVVSDAVHAMLPPPGDASFPSGHASAAMATAWAFWINTRTEEQKKMHMAGTGLVVLALLVALSRLYLGMHFPTDVISGILLGIICATIIYVTARHRRNYK